MNTINNPTPNTTGNDGSSTMTIGVSGSIASGSEMLTGAHSTGVLFGQNTSQQKNDFLLRHAETSKSVSRILEKKVNLKGSSLVLKNKMKLASLEQLEVWSNNYEF